MPKKIYQHNLSKNFIDKNVISILKKLTKAGFEAYLVGGAVRDALLNIQPKDFDIATNAHPEQVRKLFRNSRIIGKRFKIVHIYFGRYEIIEVATFRASGENAHTTNQGLIVRDNVYGTMEQDAMRRDFTINSLYYDYQQNCIVDFHNGMQAIKNRQVILVGDALKRYQEDPVRMLRAIRFSAKLQFSIESNTKKPIKEMAELLNNIPVARLYEEYLKLFHFGYGLATFKLLRQFHLFHFLFPKLSERLNKSPKDLMIIETALQDTDSRIKNSMSVNPAYLYAVFLWADFNSSATNNCKNMPFLLCLNKLAYKVLQQQRKSISIPKYLAKFIQEVWTLQYSMQNMHGKNPFKLLKMAKFRGAYDFLCLRYRSGEVDLKEAVQFWTEFQTADSERRNEMAQLN